MKEFFNIYLIFFKMGAVTFGGGYAMLPILRKEIVEKNNWLKEEEVMDFFAISQGLPGIIAVNVSVFIGYSRAKILGGISAALGVVSPSIIIISIIAMSLSNFEDNMYVKHALAGVSVCVSALIIDSVIAMWKKGVKDLFGVVLFLVIMICMLFTSISPVLLVILSAMSGVLYKNNMLNKRNS
ncbi:MAG: chromate transporter [bacterium]